MKLLGQRKLLIGCMSLALFAAACAQHRPVAVQEPLTCEDLLAKTDLNAAGDEQLAIALDASETGGRPDSCWMHLMRRALKENRKVPMHYLIEAVKVFNKQQYAEEFQLAVYRYLAELAERNGGYRAQDRALLESWCRLEIRSAASVKDPNLIRARTVCRKLDQQLYARLFE